MSKSCFVFQIILHLVSPWMVTLNSSKLWIINNQFFYSSILISRTVLWTVPGSNYWYISVIILIKHATVSLHCYFHSWSIHGPGINGFTVWIFTVTITQCFLYSMGFRNNVEPFMAWSTCFIHNCETFISWCYGFWQY